MYRTLMRTVMALALMIGGVVAANAAGPKITDPAKVDSDYALQGEYSGTFEDNGETLKAGAQIIALGNEEFAISFYPGGLPGDGFGRDKSKVTRANGKLENGEVKFSSDQGPPSFLKTASRCLTLKAMVDRSLRKSIERVRRSAKSLLRERLSCSTVLT